MFSDKNQRIIKTNNDKYTHDGGTKTSAHFVGFFLINGDFLYHPNFCLAGKI